MLLLFVLIPFLVGGRREGGSRLAEEEPIQSWTCYHIHFPLPLCLQLQWAAIESEPFALKELMLTARLGCVLFLLCLGNISFLKINCLQNTSCEWCDLKLCSTAACYARFAFLPCGVGTDVSRCDCRIKYVYTSSKRTVKNGTSSLKVMT